MHPSVARQLGLDDDGPRGGTGAGGGAAGGVEEEVMGFEFTTLRAGPLLRLGAER